MITDKQAKDMANMRTQLEKDEDQYFLACLREFLGLEPIPPKMFGKEAE